MGRYTELKVVSRRPWVVFAIARSFFSFMAPNQSILLIDFMLIVRGRIKHAREKADVGIFPLITSKTLALRLAYFDIPIRSIITPKNTGTAGVFPRGPDPKQFHRIYSIAAGNLSTRLNDGAPTTAPLTADCVITDGAWHRVGVVWDGSRRHLYADGIEVAVDAAPLGPLLSATESRLFGTRWMEDPAMVGCSGVYPPQVDRRRTEAGHGRCRTGDPCAAYFLPFHTLLSLDP